MWNSSVVPARPGVTWSSASSSRSGWRAQASSLAALAGAAISVSWGRSATHRAESWENHVPGASQNSGSATAAQARARSGNRATRDTTSRVDAQVQPHASQGARCRHASHAAGWAWSSAAKVGKVTESTTRWTAVAATRAGRNKPVARAGLRASHTASRSSECGSAQVGKAQGLNCPSRLWRSRPSASGGSSERPMSISRGGTPASMRRAAPGWNSAPQQAGAQGAAEGESLGRQPCHRADVWVGLYGRGADRVGTGRGCRGRGPGVLRVEHRGSQCLQGDIVVLGRPSCAQRAPFRSGGQCRPGHEPHAGRLSARSGVCARHTRPQGTAP